MTLGKVASAGSRQESTALESLFQSKVALVTGGGTGIGRAASIAIARQGAKVLIAANNVDESEQTAAMIRSAGGEASFVETDVTQAAQVQAMVATCLRAYGGLDIAVNNAGLIGTAAATTADYDEQTWDRVVDVNLKGVWLCMKYEISPMLERGRGAIVNMSSTAGLKGGRAGAAYHASKHGVVGLTKAVAHEFGARGIRVNAVCPSILSEPMNDLSSRREIPLMRSFAAAHPIGRLGTMDEVVSAILWLCSDGASFVTGHALPVDGGLLS